MIKLSDFVYFFLKLIGYMDCQTLNLETYMLRSSFFIKDFSAESKVSVGLSRYFY